MMREEFEALARGQGYADPVQVSFEPFSRSQTHTHDKVSFVYVVKGEFILNTAEGARSHGPGETCLLDKDIDHAEEAGPQGATILVARK